MIHEITLNGKTYGVEGDHYDGDLLLTCVEGTYKILNGYTELYKRAMQELEYFDRVTGSLECEKSQIRYWIETNMTDFIKKNFARAEFVEP